ncbi:hypothetical protein [Cohnella phaseoli]|uniref:Uncharacterized protein n=1 Tax=Cohnella phaseoli TaxID=456490 RepID=A0A3D9KBJ7_9BACL|nr:hypothetical protein [Cohnella phaseoli]RED83299.1 hypothetical protein DFP98_108142 [Cohnella phaseoli]
MKINSPKIHSAFIIAATVIFFPVAILLILIRFALHSPVNHLRAQDYRVVGHAFMTFYALCVLILILALSSDPTTTVVDLILVAVVMAVILVTPGIVFYVLANARNKKMQLLYTRYKQLTLDDGVQTVSGLAQFTGESSKNVTQDISFMIASGLFRNASLDSAGRITVTRRSSPAASSSSEAAASTERGAAVRTPRAQTVAVICSGCGSSSEVVPGERKECEFCGNMLSV